VVAWYFPAVPRSRLAHLNDSATLRRAYAKRFDSRRGGAACGRELASLAGQTRLWHATWYDSTLLVLLGDGPS
jgi:hypothetical protein